MFDKKQQRSISNNLNKQNFSSEVRFIQELTRRNIELNFARNLCLENRYFGDFVWPQTKLVIEIDGFEHKKQKSIRHDMKRDARLERCGWIIVRISFPFTKETIDQVLADWQHLMIHKGPLSNQRVYKIVERQTQRKTKPRKPKKVKIVKQKSLVEIANEARNKQTFEDFKKRQALFKKPRRKDVLKSAQNKP